MSEVLQTDRLNEGKPERSRAVEGKIDRYVTEVCLLEQPFVKDPDITVGELITAKIAKSEKTLPCGARPLCAGRNRKETRGFRG